MSCKVVSRIFRPSIARMEVSTGTMACVAANKALPMRRLPRLGGQSMTAKSKPRMAPSSLRSWPPWVGRRSWATLSSLPLPGAKATLGSRLRMGSRPSPRHRASAKRQSSSTPSQRELAAWPSRSTSSTCLPSSPSAAVRLTAVVVLPVPPFSLTIAIVSIFPHRLFWRIVPNLRWHGHSRRWR